MIRLNNAPQMFACLKRVMSATEMNTEVTELFADVNVHRAMNLAHIKVDNFDMTRNDKSELEPLRSLAKVAYYPHYKPHTIR